MKLTKILAISALAGALAMSAGCFPNKVPAGNTAVIVNMMGSDKGVSNVEAGTGWKWLTWNEELFLFPTFNQNFNLPGAVVAQDRDGMRLTFPLGMTARAKEGSAPTLFKTYRKGMEEIVEVNIPQVLRTSMNNAASKLTAEQMYGPGKEKFIKDVEAQVREHFEERGIVIESLFINGEIGLPPAVVESIQKKVEATQAAQRKENELAGATADAAKVIAAAKGDKAAAILRAEGEAEALNIKGEALRKNPGILELEAIKQWDGKTPVYMGGGMPTPFVNIK